MKCTSTSPSPRSLGGLLCIATLALGLVATPSATHAAGLLVADGGFGGALEIEEHDVKVTLNNGVAVTNVTQVFRNKEQRIVEALYTFPVPKGASVSNFSMWIGGKEMVGEVIEKKRAREIYESYKQTKRDPGLLEQRDYRTFEMRIFPIPAGAEQKVQITYYQELDFDHDRATYVYPLATTTRSGVNDRVTGKFAIAFEVKSPVPIKSIESPSHAADFVFAKHDEHYQQASLELNGGSLGRDVVLSQELARPRTGLDLLTSARPGEDGFFSLTLSAGEQLQVADQGADYVFVLDVSGSMAEDGKLLLSKDCVGAFVNELGERDRFEVMTFNVQPHLAFNAPREANDAAKREALEWLSKARAAGGTVLQPALTTAYKYGSADRSLNVVILSDGMTEASERTELLRLIAQRPGNAKVFCIGVGNDVNRPLLEQLADDSGGLASFISRGDDFARQAKAFRRKLLRPVATGLQFDIKGVDISELEPRQIPNLYHGAPVRLYGRYRGNGPAEVKVRGSVNGVAWEQKANLEFPAEDKTNPELERMWAWKRIDGMLKEADRSGSRTQVIPEVVRLGEGFSVVTEYTSFLVLENDAEYQRWKVTRVNDARTARDRGAQLARAADLEKIRNKAVAGIGPGQPEPIRNAAPLVNHTSPVPAPVPTSAQAPTAPAPARRSRGFDIHFPSGGGGGPVGPIFVAITAWFARRKATAASK